ncbi:MAG: oligosaccharide flippase family protein [Symploca sp. SIO2E9]|nr:oligosaccharide flippase family protein [Symploca sp. SIO2E9]
MNGLLKGLKQSLLGSQFAQNVAVIAGGTLLGQGLVVLASPIITRLYTPADFGVLAVYTSILSILTVAASMRYELAIPLPRKEEDAANLLVLSLSIVLCISLHLGIVVWLFGDQLINWLNIPALKSYLWLLPLGLLAAGVHQVFNYWAVRKKEFSLIAQTKLRQGFGIVFVQLGLGLLQLRPIGLLAGDMMGRSSGSWTLATFACRRDSQALKSVNIEGMRRVGYRFIGFPLISTGSAILNSAGLYIPSILLATFYGTQAAGYFALGQRVITIPMTLLGQSVAKVYFAEASNLVRQNPSALVSLFQKSVSRMLILGIAPMILLGITAPWIFKSVFGAAWIEAGQYVSVLSLPYLVHFIVVPLSQTLNILERQDLQFLWDMGRISIVAAAFFIAEKNEWNAIGAITLYSLALLLAYSCLMVILCYALHNFNTNNLDSQ